MSFLGGGSLVRSGHAAHNLAVLRDLALRHRDTTLDVGIEAKHLACAWDDIFYRVLAAEMQLPWALACDWRKPRIIRALFHCVTLGQTPL